MEDLLLVLGLALFLLGLLTGLVVPKMRNPRMGVASHLQGMTNGPFLMVVGVAWHRVDLPHAWEIVTVVLVVFAAYANWLATQLAAVWGAGYQFAPGAAGEHRSTAGRERIVSGLLVALTPAMIVAVVLLAIGILR